MEVEGGIRWLCSARHEPIGLQWKQPDRLVHLKSAGVVLGRILALYSPRARIVALMMALSRTPLDLDTYGP